MIKIGFSGVPGTGKTSLARAAASALRSNFNHIELVSEYARKYIVKYGAIDTIMDQYRITEKQIEWEHDISPNTDLLITDSPVPMGFVYVHEFRKQENKKTLLWENDIFKLLNNHSQYDYIFHLVKEEKDGEDKQGGVVLPFRDGIRVELHFNPDWREKAENCMKAVWEYMFPPKNLIYVPLMGFEDRLDYVLQSLTKEL